MDICITVPLPRPTIGNSKAAEPEPFFGSGAARTSNFAGARAGAGANLVKQAPGLQRLNQAPASK